MGEETFPVCSPTFYQAHLEQLKSPEGLLNLPLIHDLSMDHHSGFTTWDTWLHFHQITNEDNPRGLKINNSVAVLQAAINGQGVALARSAMVYDDLRAGRLVRLYPEINCPSSLAYYVVYREECRTLPKLNAFKDWLIQQAQQADILELI
ncbi:LysR substrate-binding domain-containing protein [Acinetobacter sp. YH12201]|uniref:LysR substrate-binding domain-containing protein n=1 Tax=Acinetobacter sp. YH12201 TaxID=2601140 RepID=UPI0015D40659|nr:LysR substrate-binding domain-containing protein [Acinetobacter sp. YH12201]